MLTRWLNDNEIEYIEYKVDENPFAAQYMVSLSGQMGVPFTTVESDDGQIDKILGFDVSRLQNSLRV